VAGPIQVPTSVGPKELYSESYALLIGESSYQQPWNVLDRVPQELLDLRDALIALGFEPGNIDIQRDVRSGDLLGLFQTFVNDADHAKSTARLFVFYAGHGFTGPLGSGYIVPIDAPGSTERGFYSKALGISAVRDALGDATARHLLVIFDSCFSGSIFEHKGEVERLTPLQFETLSKGRIQVITAGTASQRVPASDEFVKVLIAGAKGGADLLNNGVVTADELAIYMKKHVHATTPQSGDIGLDTGGEFAFIPNQQQVQIIPISAAVVPNHPPPQIQPTPDDGVVMRQYSRTCTYTQGPKSGKTEYFPPEIPANPAEIGQSCTDGLGNTGYAVKDDLSKAVKLSTVCLFQSGPRVYQTQDYAGMAAAAPVGTPCQDGMGSFGVVVPRVR